MTSSFLIFSNIFEHALMETFLVSHTYEEASLYALKRVRYHNITVIIKETCIRLYARKRPTIISFRPLALGPSQMLPSG